MAKQKSKAKAKAKAKAEKTVTQQVGALLRKIERLEKSNSKIDASVKKMTVEAREALIAEKVSKYEARLGRKYFGNEGEVKVLRERAEKMLNEIGF